MNKIGKYIIKSELGKGAMGIVYDAFDEDMQREVEFKVRNLLMDTFAHDLNIYDETIQKKIEMITKEILDMIRDCY